ncbi:MAG: response regulator, partial [Alphaproteobacteria bacterium]|nr:response regulator [Alphaproteobacteria bacterium]
MSSAAIEKIKILVIDDDQLLRVVIGKILKKIECEMLEAKDGNEALAIFQAKKPHLVITDILMPDKEGLETIKDIRKLDPAVPIIAMSSGGGTNYMSFLQYAKRLGANQTMAKPIMPDDLLLAVRSLLSL